MSFRREVAFGSSHLRLICNWLSEIDFAADMDDLTCSGFIIDKHQIGFETLDSKIARNYENYSVRMNFLEETQHKNKRPMLNINKTQSYKMNLSDLLNAELDSDSLKMCNQTWAETLLALGTDLVEHT